MPVPAMELEPARDTPGSAPPEPAPPEPFPLPPLPLAPVVVAPTACVPETAAPVAVPELAPAGAAVAFTIPHVGVVCPAATSVGVRSPQEYAFPSAAVGGTAPGTLCWTALMPYCSRDNPRLA